MAYSINSGIQISLDGVTYYSLTDHNRAEIDVTPSLIEHSARMANGRMRKYVIATKARTKISSLYSTYDSILGVTMSKLSDTLKAALDKKKGIHHPDGSDAGTTVEKKAKVKPSAPQGKKPPTRSAGRGR